MEKTLVRKFAWGILLCLNLLVGVVFLACAYSPYINPVSHPYLACIGLAFPIPALLNALFLVFWLMARWRFSSVVPVVIFLLGWGSLRSYLPLSSDHTSSGGDTIKVLTYNVEGFGDKGTGDAQSILAYLRESDADIICIQEFAVGGHALQKEIDEALSAYPHHKVLYTKGNDGLACYSRYPILSASRIAYESQWNGSVLFRLQMGKDTLCLINNHLESNKLNSEDKSIYHEILTSPREDVVKSGGKHLFRKLAQAVSIRAVQSDSVARVIRQNHAHSLIVCGDFNDSPVSYMHRVIGHGLTDAYVEAGFGPGYSYNKNRFYFRIDHMFVSNDFRVLACKVDRSIKASDHYPLWCLLEKASKN